MLRSVPNSEGKQPICRQAARKLPTILISHVYHGPAGIRTQYRIHEQSALGGVVFVQIRMEVQMVLSEVGERRYREAHMIHAAVSYTHLRAHETDSYLVCRLLLEKKKKTK